MKKKIILFGGLGVIGHILLHYLHDYYNFIIADIKYHSTNSKMNHLKIDITSYEQITKSLPNDIDAIVNLTALPETEQIVNRKIFQEMADVYVKGTYNLLLACRELSIPKIVLSSSNRVTGGFEKDGMSLINRQITTEDYPNSGNVYGAMKLFIEQIGNIFSMETGLSVICLRIGTVIEHEYEFLKKNERAKRTVLSHVDTANIYKAAIESDVTFGIYYAVSDNPDRPWSIDNTIKDLNYKPEMNSRHIVSGKKEE